MPILLFLIDTSASMNQRTYLGTTYLDIAKGAVEIFMKVKNNFTPIFFSLLFALIVLRVPLTYSVEINMYCFVFFNSCVPETRLVEATGTC